jgi:hypothetical protein
MVIVDKLIYNGPIVDKLIYNSFLLAIIGKEKNSICRTLILVCHVDIIHIILNLNTLRTCFEICTYVHVTDKDHGQDPGHIEFFSCR